MEDGEQKAISRGQGAGGIRPYVPCLLLCVLCSLLFFNGCTSVSKGEIVLAVVDGEPVTGEDLRYSLNIAHRREDLSSAGGLDLLEYVKKLVDERLIVQEARRIGMDTYPEVRKAVDAFVLRESVVRLHDEEIAQKVSVTEEELMDYYKKNYERFTLGIIEVASEEEIKEISERLKKGQEFESLAGEYSQHPSEQKGGQITITRGSMPEDFEHTVSSLKKGEISEVVNKRNRYHIVKLIDREEAPEGQFAGIKGSIRKSIRKQRENERSDAYLKVLREKSDIKIDQELLSSAGLNTPDGGREDLLKDERLLVEVDGDALTVRDFVLLAKPSGMMSHETLIDNWINRKLVDREALGRHYEQRDKLKKMINRYEDQLLKETFIRRVILPQIAVNDEMLREYYEKHKEEFLGPEYFRIQQITVRTQEEAEEILEALKQGSDFTWIAKQKSIDSLASKGGDTGWVLRRDMPEPLRKAVDSFMTGDISPAMEVGSSSRIVKLAGKKGGEVREFSAVREDVFSACFNDQVKTALKENVNRLKEETRIQVNEEKVRKFEEELEKQI